MNDANDPPRPGGGKGCGCLAALGFLAVVGLPVLFVFSFGLSPCEHGPCNPNGARDLRNAALVLLALAALIGLAVWRLVHWRAVRAAARGEKRGRGLEIALGALLLLVGAALFKLIFG